MQALRLARPAPPAAPARPRRTRLLVGEHVVGPLALEQGGAGQLPPEHALGVLGHGGLVPIKTLEPDDLDRVARGGAAARAAEELGVAVQHLAHARPRHVRAVVRHQPQPHARPAVRVARGGGAVARAHLRRGFGQRQVAGARVVELEAAQLRRGFQQRQQPRVAEGLAVADVEVAEAGGGGRAGERLQRRVGQVELLEVEVGEVGAGGDDGRDGGVAEGRALREAQALEARGVRGQAGHAAVREAAAAAEVEVAQGTRRHDRPVRQRVHRRVAALQQQAQALVVEVRAVRHQQPLERVAREQVAQEVGAVPAAHLGGAQVAQARAGAGHALQAGRVDVRAPADVEQLEQRAALGEDLERRVGERGQPGHVDVHQARVAQQEIMHRGPVDAAPFDAEELEVPAHVGDLLALGRPAVAHLHAAAQVQVAHEGPRARQQLDQASARDVAVEVARVELGPQLPVEAHAVPALRHGRAAHDLLGPQVGEDLDLDLVRHLAPEVDRALGGGGGGSLGVSDGEGGFRILAARAGDHDGHARGRNGDIGRQPDGRGMGAVAEQVALAEHADAGREVEAAHLGAVRGEAGRGGRGGQAGRERRGRLGGGGAGVGVAVGGEGPRRARRGQRDAGQRGARAAPVLDGARRAGAAHERQRRRRRHAL